MFMTIGLQLQSMLDDFPEDASIRDMLAEINHSVETAKARTAQLSTFGINLAPLVV